MLFFYAYYSFKIAYYSSKAQHDYRPHVVTQV